MTSTPAARGAAGRARIRLGPLVLALLLLAPLAVAHVPHARGSIQYSEGERSVSIEKSGTAAFVNLTLVADIERDPVMHVIDPAQGLVLASYRPSPPEADARYEQRWSIERILEYHDANADGRYEPGLDGQIRSWRLSSYQWTGPVVSDATIARTAVRDIAWTGQLQGAPNVTLEAVAAGKPLSDEGANARSQDVLLYLTFSAFPKRNVGALYVLESTIATRGNATLVEERTKNLTTDVALTQGSRRGFLDWGGSAIVDGAEASALVFVGEPQEDGDDVARALRLDFPRLDRSLRLVVVSAVEYATPARSPDLTAPLVALVLVGVALSRRAR